jgi:hypothetical protein
VSGSAQRDEQKMRMQICTELRIGTRGPVLMKKEVSRESSLPKDLLAFLPPLYNERADGELAEDNKKEHKMSRCR